MPYNTFITHRQLMTKYRIKKGTYGDVIRYYPQEKFLFWWHNTVEPSFDGGYSTLEKAQEAICSRIKEPEPVIDYIDFDYERDCAKIFFDITSKDT